MGFEIRFLWMAVCRLVLAVIMGALIGGERARHGRAAGIRTHILVCLGAALTSLTSFFVWSVWPDSGDIFRISAQVVSGIGFLGAGMIILKNNNMIMGLTTAAGVWATGIIGVAVGYGFYYGAAVCMALLLLTTYVFSKFEKKKKATEVIYIEIDDIYKTNEIVEQLAGLLQVDFVHRTTAPKSGFSGHLGIDVVVDERPRVDFKRILELENVVYIEEE